MLGSRLTPPQRESQQGAGSLVLIQRAAAVPKLNCSNQQGVGICGLRSGGADAAVPAMASSSDPDKLMTKADKL